MISKRDWRRHLHKLWKIMETLKGSGSDYSLTVNGEEVFMVDIYNDKLYCRTKVEVELPVVETIGGHGYVRTKSAMVRTYQHPESFRAGIGLNKVNASVKLTYSHSGLNNIEKVIKTR